MTEMFGLAVAWPHSNSVRCTNSDAFFLRRFRWEEEYTDAYRQWIVEEFNEIEVAEDQPDQFEELRPAFMQVIEYGNAMGFDMIQGDHEDAPGQLELNWMFDDVLRNSDRLTTYRQICAQVAREKGIHACFMSKPFMNVSASGCQLHHGPVM